MILSHDNLYNYYETNFALMQHHKWGLFEIEEMLPFEREIYVSMLSKYLEEEKQKLENR